MVKLEAYWSIRHNHLPVGHYGCVGEFGQFVKAWELCRVQAVREISEVGCEDVRGCYMGTNALCISPWPTSSRPVVAILTKRMGYGKLPVSAAYGARRSVEGGYKSVNDCACRGC